MVTEVRSRPAAVALAIAVLTACAPAAARAKESMAEPPPADEGRMGVTTRLVGELEPPALAELVREVLARNPGVAAAEARARAARERAAQDGALPDPTAMVTAFVSAPETRVGPQRLMATLTQKLPWFGKLRLRHQMATLAAVALTQQAEAMRLEVLTRARKLAFELAFLDRYAAIMRRKKVHLEQHEEVARARYTTGAGLSQDVLKLQAEITRIDNKLLEIENRRASQVAELNALRDLPQETPVAPVALPAAVEVSAPLETLRQPALENRPEVAAAAVEVARAELAVELARQGYRPDLSVGLTYTLVDPRSDPPGRINPPDRNGEDVLGIQGGITIPFWRQRLEAAVREALELELAAEENRRRVVSRIDGELGDLASRLPLTRQQVGLLEDVLTLQAEESVSSAGAAYMTGRLTALELLDAEHVLFDALTAAARARADYAILLARIEGAVGLPLAAMAPTTAEPENQEREP